MNLPENVDPELKAKYEEMVKKLKQHTGAPSILFYPEDKESVEEIFGVKFKEEEQ